MDSVTWLATGSPNGQVRAMSAFKLDNLAARLRTATPQGESEQAPHRQLAADIKRFLERPLTPSVSCKRPTPRPAPPSERPPWDWLSPAPWQ